MPLDAALAHLASRCPQSPGLWDALRSLGPLLVSHEHALAQLDPPLPVRKLWGRDLRATRAANVVLGAELARVVAALEAADLPSLAFKGASALDGLYPDPGWRPMDDADLLVRPADRARAVGLLTGLGFAPVPIDDGRLGPVGASLHGAQAFRRPLGALHVEVDLHWHWVSDARLRAAFPGADGLELWQRAARTRLDTADAAIITAALQMFGHPWSHPLGYVDLHLLVEGFGADEWRALVERGRRHGLATPLYWGLRFASELFGAPCGPALTALRPAPLGLRLGERLVGGDWLGLTAGRREQAARDLFVLVAAGPAGALRLLRATMVHHPADLRCTARTALWLTQAALAVSRRG